MACIPHRPEYITHGEPSPWRARDSGATPPSKRRLLSPAPAEPVETEPALPLPLEVVSSSCCTRGDGKPCALPTYDDGHPWRAILPATMAALLAGQYPQIKFVVADCRFPYEYDGGHVKDSINVWTEKQLEEMFFSESAESSQIRATSQHTVFIFHCEFSSRRAPRLLQALRNRDRQIHAVAYPALHFPDIYVLRGGYAEFFSRHSELCTPQSYLPMLASEFRSELIACQQALREKERTRTVRPAQPVQRLNLSLEGLRPTLLRRWE